MFGFWVINNQTYFLYLSLQKEAVKLDKWKTSIPFIIDESGRRKPAPRAALLGLPHNVPQI